jgi:tetratricopeptide (TPR) repeat protein
VPQSERIAAGFHYVNIALTYVNMHLYDDGARYGRRAAEIGQSIPSAQSLACQGLSVLANALRYQGDLEGALKTIREARRLSEKITYRNETTRLFNLYGPVLREARILGEEGAVNLGLPAEAISVYQKGLDMTEQIASKDSNDSASRARVGTIALDLGNILRDRDPRRALAVYDLGIRRLSETPRNVKARRDQAVLLAASSYSLRSLHHPADAKRRVDAAFAILKDTGDYPSDRIRLDGYAYPAVCALADYEAETGDPRLALQMYLQLLDRVMATKPDPFSDLRDAPKLSRFYDVVSVLYRRSGDLASAKAMSARRGEIWRIWQQKLPQNSFVRREVEAGASAVY